MQKVKIFLSKSFPFAIGIIISLVIFLLPKYSFDILLFSIISVISIGLYAISPKTNHKVILRILSVYIFLNFILFPILYLLILKENSESFEFDTKIFQLEKLSSLEAIEEYYQPNQLEKKLSIIKVALQDTSNLFDTTINYLNDGNVIILNKFILSKDCIAVPADRPMYKAIINICNQEGVQQASIQDSREGCKLGKSGQSVRQYLTLFSTQIDYELKQFKQQTSKIAKHNDIWTYKQILPYSINIFSTGNMIPKSRTANVVFYINQFLVATIVLSLLTSFFFSYFEKKDK